MLDFLTRLLAIHWRRSGATIREVDVLGSRIRYAEFAPPEREPADLAERRRAGPRARTRSAPALVLLHGLGASGASFYPVIGPLRRHYRVIVPDLPGYGASSPPPDRAYLTFAELLDATEELVARVAPRGAYLAGNSMGGWIAAKLAARRPDLARGIALLNPGGPALRAEDWVDFAQLLATEGDEAMRELVTRLFHRPPLGMSLVSRDVHRLMRRPSVQSLVATLRPEDFVSEEELAAVDCPSVLIWGENDRLIPEACRDFFLEKLPRVRHEPIPDCGHCPQLECPRRTADILLSLPRMRRPRTRRAGSDGPRAAPAPVRAATVPGVA